MLIIYKQETEYIVRGKSQTHTLALRNTLCKVNLHAVIFPCVHQHFFVL